MVKTGVDSFMSLHITGSWALEVTLGVAEWFITSVDSFMLLQVAWCCALCSHTGCNWMVYIQCGLFHAASSCAFVVDSFMLLQIPYAFVIASTLDQAVIRRSDSSHWHHKEFPSDLPKLMNCIPSWVEIVWQRCIEASAIIIKVWSLHTISYTYYD